MDDGSIIPIRTLVLDSDGTQLVPRPAGPSEGTSRLRALADAPATVRAYAADWRHFDRWCRARGQHPFDRSVPLETIVGTYLSDIHQDLAMSTLRRRVAAIVRQARLAQVPFNTKHPDIREVMRGAAHATTRDLRQAAALTTLDIQNLVVVCGADLAGVRDHALILIGFAGALRRSELVALQRRHLGWTAQGLVLRIARSKTDSEGKDIGIPFGRHERTCPVTHLRRWVEAADITDGALFRRVDRWGKPGRAALSAGSVRLLLGTRGPGGRAGRHRPRADQPAWAAGRLHHHGLRQWGGRRADHGTHAAAQLGDHARLRAAGTSQSGQPGRECRAVTSSLEGSLPSCIIANAVVPLGNTG